MIKRVSILCIKILVTITLLVLVFEEVQLSVLVDEFNKLHSLTISLILLLAFSQLLIASARWHKILSYFNIALPLQKCVAYSWAGMFFSQALPSSIGGDAYKILQIRSLNYSYQGAISSVISDRVFGLIGVLSIILIFPFVALTIGHTQILELDTVNLSLLSIFVLFLLFCLMKAVNILRRFYHSRVVIKFAEQLLLFKAAHKIILFLILSSFLIHMITVLIFFSLSHSVSVEIIPISYLIVVPLMVLVTTLPISIAGWGVREGFLVFSLGQFGVEAEKSVSISVIYGILILIFSIPGSSMWLLQNFKSDSGKA